MGCKGSKLHDQEAVALCRARADLLAAAVRHRYALADAHAALAASLESLAAPLHLLLLQDSSKLTLPSSPRKGKGGRRGRTARLHIRSGSTSGSEPASPPPASPPCLVPEQLPHPHYPYMYGYDPQPAFAYPAPASSLQFYYARSRPPPASVAVAQRAPGSERVYFGGSFDAGGGYPQYYAYGSAPAAAAAAPAPSSPRRESSWDFFNVFDLCDSYDNYYYDSTTAVAAAVPYTPSRSSREVREEEGIPDLEDDEDDIVVVKEVASAFTTAGSSGGGRRSRRRPVGGVSISPEFTEPHNVVVHKHVANNARRRPPAHRNVAMPARKRPAQRIVDDVDVANEIKAQLVRAAEAARELAPLLEVGRPSYHRRSSVYHASSRMMSAISVPHLGCKGVDLLDMGGEEKVVSSWSLSLTLERLYFWEMKLYGEVKAEEKMRLLLAKNSKRLKFLDQRGAEAHKIDATRNLLRKLSTRIRIAVRVIAKVSRKINKVRDEELGPQVNTLIQGFTKMWQDKLHSYQTQFQVMSEAKNLASVVSGGNACESIMELELELIKWIVNFSSWVNAHRNFVKALNGWLALCLNYEEEATNGVSPYSPGRIGAPLVFVICNKWSQAMDQISEKDVVNAMQALVSSVRHLWEKQNFEESEDAIIIREREKWIKILDRKTLEISKEADELNRKLAMIPSRQSFIRPPTIQTYEAHCIEASNIHINLRMALQSLENFADSSLQAFQEILRCVEEAKRLPRDNVRAP